MINIAFWRSCGNRDSTISTGANRYSSWRKSLLNWRKSLFKLAEIFGGTKLPIPLWPVPYRSLTVTYCRPNLLTLTLTLMLTLQEGKYFLPLEAN